MRWFLVISFLADVTQQIHSLRASGVMSIQTSFTTGSDSIASPKSVALLCIPPLALSFVTIELCYRFRTDYLPFYQSPSEQTSKKLAYIWQSSHPLNPTSVLHSGLFWYHQFLCGILRGYKHKPCPYSPKSVSSLSLCSRSLFWWGYSSSPWLLAIFLLVY